MQRIAIVGAGPIGLEAALFGVQAGFDVAVYERGSIAQNVLDWGHVRLFSPFGLNASPWGRAALIETGVGDALPTDDEILTGQAFALRYLVPLSELDQLHGRIHRNTDICSVSRSHTWKRDLIGQAARGEDRFQLLLSESHSDSQQREQSPDQQTEIGIPGPSPETEFTPNTQKQRESLVSADFVLDCSGTYANYNWIGAGGMPCIGERSVLGSAHYQLPDILGTGRDHFVGKVCLVIGGGYSAATAICALAKLAELDSATRVLWITRKKRDTPIAMIEDDTLAERARLAESANRLALDNDGPIDWLPGTLIHRIDYDPRTKNYTILGEKSLSKYDADEWSCCVERVIANIGYRPNRQLYEELQVHECYASSGPFKLAAALLGESSADCLSLASQGSAALRNSEPRFFILGAKSYGRDSRFLIKTGIEQIRDVFQLISEDAN